MALNRNFDSVVETTNTIGVIDRVLAGAKLGFRTLAAAGAADGDIVPLSIRAGAEFEDGLYRYNAGANSVTPVEVHASSNAGAIVNFSAGVKDVILGPLAKHVDPLAAFPFTAATGLMLRVNALLSQTDFTPKGYAKKIYDISGNGRHSDLNTFNPPKFVHNAFNTRPAWYFNVHRHTFSTMPGLGSPLACTIYGIGAAWNLISGNSHIYNWAGNPIGFSATTGLEFIYNGTLPAAHPDSQAIVQEQRPDSIMGYPVAFVHVYNGAASVNSVNNNEQGPVSPGTIATGTTNYFTIGSDSSAGISANAASYCRFLLLEMGVLNFAASVAQRALLHQYLRQMGRMSYQ